jgi:hypothetical protein
LVYAVILLVIGLYINHTLEEQKLGSPADTDNADLLPSERKEAREAASSMSSQGLQLSMNSEMKTVLAPVPFLDALSIGGDCISSARLVAILPASNFKVFTVYNQPS